MSALLFFDPVCLRPYDTRTLSTQASGGTEASLTRIADALDAYVVQHNRTASYGRYRPPQRIAGIERVVVNRDSRALPQVRAWYPDARIYLWVHDQINPGSKRGRRLAATAQLLRELQVTVVCVSDSQRHGVERTLAASGVADCVRALTIYNPIDDALAPDGTPVDERKLVFFSSPNKGLNYALDAFATLRRRMPELRLVVGNPGYKRERAGGGGGVEFLGAQPQARIHTEVRSALCTFFPNFVIPETFGLVFAESHALGTPVLTHDCGAALEVVGDPQQVLPLTAAYRRYEACAEILPQSWRWLPARLAGAAGLFDAYVERVQAWRSGARPVCVPDPRFQLRRIAPQWRALLSS